MKKIIYYVSLVNCKDQEGIPVNATITIDEDQQEEFEKYLEEEQDNVFIHAEGGNVEY